MSPSYPNDADGDALRGVASAGNDMSKPMDFDFQIAAPDEATANLVAEQAKKLGFRTSVYCDDEEADLEDAEDLWTCECTKSMIPTYEAVVAAQVQLDALAKPLDACVDGWGTFGNAQR